MGFFSNFQNSTAKTHLQGTLEGFVLPALSELTQRGMRRELRASLRTALVDSEAATSRASTEGQLSIGESMLGKMLLRRKDDIVLSSTYTLVGLYIAARARSVLNIEHGPDFELISEHAWQAIYEMGGTDCIQELLALDAALGVDRS